MFPMVTTPAEFRAASALLHAAKAAVAPDAEVEAGVMVEVPALALTAAALADEVGFFSIGTNDLVQYTLAAERGNGAVAALADPLHPAVLRLIGAVCDAARERGVPVSVCGEVAADPAATALLLGLGVRALSVAAPAVAAIKAAVRDLDLGAAERLARDALAASSAEEVRALAARADGSR
jgi:phosphocarrier protein FPr